MMSSAKAAIYGISVGALGLLISLTLFGASLEENFGLEVFFKLRGSRAAPEEVMIITIDRDSSSRLNLPSSPRKWPRSVHARLVDILAQLKPAVIAFDLIFTEAHQSEEDDLFAKAIGNAGNVVLSEWLQSELLPVYDCSGAKAGQLHIEKTNPPLTRFGNCAIASAPFVLPKVPVKLNSYYCFLTSAEDIPTLPMVVFQIYALNVYDEMIGLLAAQDPSSIILFPANRDMIFENKNIKEMMRIFRNHFQQNSIRIEKMFSLSTNRHSAMNAPENNHILESLIRAYQGPKKRYLNFYGPPGTIITIPYYQILEDFNNREGAPYYLDLKNKAVFIGVSERARVEQKDGFYTVFSQPDGLDLSGVEIAATAFANILEGKNIIPLHPAAHLLIVGAWGVLLGVLCMMLPAIASAVGIAVFSTLYVFMTHYMFKQNALWFPLIIPIGFQVPVAFFGSLAWKYFTVNKERKNFRTAFGYYLPDDVVDQLSKGLKNVEKGSKLVYGTCMITDGEKYTALSEKMKPDELSTFMNKYFQVIFEPVRRYSGIVSDIRGDSILAIWATTYPDCKLRKSACKAALEIIQAVNEFNCLSAPLILPTRIGIHSGLISLGHVGAIDHFEYRAAGDIVNTASRMEGLNKYLGTKVLISAEVLHQVDGFLIRNLGEFMFAGKSKPVEVFELICRYDEAFSCQLNLCDTFARAFDAYRNRYWEKAIDLFSQSMNFESGHGPSRYYLDLCKSLWKNPPDTDWDGVVYLSVK